MQAIEKIKSINKESITSANNNIFTWNAHGDRYLAKKDRIDYSTLFLIHSIINSNKEKMSRQVITEQTKKGMPNTLYEIAKEIGQSLVINTDQAGNMKKSTQKKEVKTRIKKNMQKKTN